MTQPPVSQKRARMILALISFGIFVAADDLTVISTLLPQMITDFEIPVPAGLDDASWIVSAYLIAYIGTMPFMGRVSDLYGRWKVYVACLGIFAFGSLIVPLVESLPWLITFRAIQAIGGGAMVPVGMAIIGDIFPSERRPLAMGSLVAIDTAGWIFGPLYGAFLVRYLDWRWQFYINIPASILAAAGAYWALKDLPQPKRKVSLDIPGALLFTAGLVALNMALSFSGGRAATGPTFDFNAPPPTTRYVIPLLALAALLLGVFVYLERRTPDPLIDLGMFKHTNFTQACAINFLVGVALIIAMVNVPLFINTILPEGNTVDEALQQAAAHSGQVLAVMTGSMSLASLLGGWLCKRFGYRLPTVIGLLFVAAGFGFMGTWTIAISYPSMAVHLALAGIGFGLVTSPLSTSVVDAVDETQRGVASGLVVILRLIGMSVGLSLLTAWGLRRFEQLSRGYTLSQLGEVITEITAQVLTGIFLAAGGALLLAVPIAFLLKKKA
ncbi:MAG: putative triacylglyceride transporter [Chloroflexi bacterium]|nr:putative triacylglyceride transporter [Chloroflexota bacterium]